MTDLIPNLTTSGAIKNPKKKSEGRPPLVISEFNGFSLIDAPQRETYTFNFNTNLLPFLVEEGNTISILRIGSELYCVISTAALPDAKNLSLKDHKGKVSGAAFSVYQEEFLKEHNFADKDRYRLVPVPTKGIGHWFKFEYLASCFPTSDPVMTVSAPRLGGRVNELAAKRIKHHETKDEWEAFRADVVNRTTTTCKLYPTKIQNHSDLGKSGFHVDHIYSIREGFDNQIPPEILAHHSNLRVIVGTDNMSKGSRSDITEDELLTQYTQEHGYKKTSLLLEAYRKTRSLLASAN